MLKVLSNILCDLDPKVKVIGQKACTIDFCSSFILFLHKNRCNSYVYSLKASV